jgi:hypothetical protein
MTLLHRKSCTAVATLLLILAADVCRCSAAEALTLARDGHWLVIRGAHLPGGEIRINYLEAYCRPGSTDADWVKHTVIPHQSELVSVSSAGQQMQLRDTLEDGVVVEHEITARGDEIDFRLTARTPTSTASEAHWAQPCVRLGTFTGFSPELSGDLDDYLPKCFVFVDGKLTRMPLQRWAKQARYTRARCGAGRASSRRSEPPSHSEVKLSHGLIGCFSADEKLIFATAWEPYQELFQGVGRCLHSDCESAVLHPARQSRSAGRSISPPQAQRRCCDVTSATFPSTGRSEAVPSHSPAVRGRAAHPYVSRSRAPHSPHHRSAAAGKFMWNFGVKGLLSVERFKRRIKRGEYFPPFFYLSILNTATCAARGAGRRGSRAQQIV